MDVNKTTTIDQKPKSPSPDQKQDLNMTAPLVDHMKADRKVINDFVNQPTKQRETSVNYSTIQHAPNDNYSGADRMALYQGRT